MLVHTSGRQQAVVIRVVVGCAKNGTLIKTFDQNALPIRPAETLGTIQAFQPLLPAPVSGSIHERLCGLLIIDRIEKVEESQFEVVMLDEVVVLDDGDPAQGVLSDCTRKKAAWECS